MPLWTFCIATVFKYIGLLSLETQFHDSLEKNLGRNMFLTILLTSLSLLTDIGVAAKKRLVVDEVDVEQELLLLKATVSSFQSNLTALEKENANLRGQQTVLQNQLTALSSSAAKGRR